MAQRVLVFLIAVVLALPVVTRSMETPRGNFDVKSREVRSLSGDGNTMTVLTTLDTPRGKQTLTVGYSKTAD